jgi:hypothetical protein
MTAVAARADDAADLKAKLAAGLRGTTSLRVVMTLPSGTATMIVRLGSGPSHRGMAVKVQMNGIAAAQTLDMYIVDGYMYQSINGSRWERRPLPDPTQAVHLGPAFGEPGQIVPQPDRVVDGVTYGAFTESPAVVPASPLTTFECTYDKATGRLHVCESALGTMTYSGYNDPANVVELPTAAKTAIDLPAIPPIPPEPAPMPSSTR